MLQVETFESRLLLSVFAPDVTFGMAGTVTVPNSQIVSSGISNRLLVAGPKDSSSSADTILTLLKAGGARDKMYGDDGQIDVGQVAGLSLVRERFYAAYNLSSPFQSLEGRSRNWILDTAFSDDGKRALPYAALRSTGTVNSARLVNATAAPGNAGSVFLRTTLGYTNGDVTAVRQLVELTTEGDVDTSFEQGGYFDIPDTAVNAVVTSNGIIVTFGDTTQRYKLDGTGLDPTFGSNGTLNLSIAGTPIEQSDGKLVYLTSVSNSRLARLNVNGSLDTTFATNGFTASFDTEFQQPVVDATGGFLVSPLSSSTIYRFTPDGQIDSNGVLNGTANFQGSIHGTDDHGNIYSFATNGDGQQTLTNYNIAFAQAVSADGTLYFTGDNATDDIAFVSLGGGKRLAATMNGNTITYPLSSIHALNFRLGSGNNSVNTTLSSAISKTLPTTVTTGHGRDTIMTGDGDDIIDAGSGKNTIQMGNGDDTVTAGGTSGTAYDQSISGGAGDKTVTVKSGADVSIDLGDGKHTISTPTDDVHTVITVGAGGGKITSFGSSVKITVGGAIGTVIHAYGKKNAVSGSAGNDNIAVDANATVYGNAGNDTITYTGEGTTAPVYIDAGDGNDTVRLSANGNDAFITDATIHGGNGNDSLDATGVFSSSLIYGEVGNDTIQGSERADTIYGGMGNDSIRGGDGNDTIDAGDGNDTINGDNGNDTIDGGTGNDSIHGGAGNDYLISYDKFVDNVFGDAGTNKGDVDSSDKLTDIQQLK